MWNQYQYFHGVITPEEFPAIGTVGRISGLMGMEEAIENLRNLRPLMFFCEDDNDGYISLTQGNFDHSMHMFAILDVVKLGDSADRVRALNACMAQGLKILKKMLSDSQDWATPVYGFDRSRIDYQRIGPLVNNTWGYMFTYSMRNENFTLE